MYLSASTMQAKPGRSREVRVVAVELAKLIDDAGGTGSAAWTAITGAPFGAFMVSSRFDSLADYVTTIDRLTGSAEFATASAAVADALAQPAETFVNRVAMASDGYEAKPFVALTNVVVAAGQYTAASAWCTEMLDFVAKATGSGGLMLRSLGGRVGEMSFVFGADDAAAWQAREEKLLTDEGYAARLDQADGLFEPGSDRRVLMAQL